MEVGWGAASAFPVRKKSLSKASSWGWKCFCCSLAKWRSSWEGGEMEKLSESSWEGGEMEKLMECKFLP